MRLVFYGILTGLAAYCLYRFLAPAVPVKRPSVQPVRLRWRSKRVKEDWVQVFETASWEDARRIQARLEEEEVECILYEQGKKGVHGNEFPGVGVAVPKSVMGRAQQLVSRLMV